ncbi:Nif3-like dinuclear metal center hexameric protein [Clostridium sp.]|uniref:Nif3-like dinuclear metal center hexameric protein n=1 Tax=Clostridium sp. TaxID=1506 RepID=UPI002FC987DE
MSLKIKDIIKIMETMAPTKFAEGYDNVGLMIGNKEVEVNKILIALDVTLEVIDEAMEKECNVILTHHPVLFLKPKTITTDTLLGRKIIKLIENKLNVYSSHTNLDVVQEGLNDLATELLGYNNYRVLEVNSNIENNNNGVGRIIKVNSPTTLLELCNKVKEKYNAPFVRYVGDKNKEINTIALINGSGEDYFNLARLKGCDCIITGDTSYHHVSDMREDNIAIIDAGHFVTEWPPMKIIGKRLNNILKDMGHNNKVIISTYTFDPYNLA